MTFQGRSLLKSNSKLHLSQVRLSTVVQNFKDQKARLSPREQSPFRSKTERLDEEDTVTTLNINILRTINPNDSAREFNNTISLMYRRKSHVEVKTEPDADMEFFKRKMMKLRRKKEQESRTSLLQRLLKHVVKSGMVDQSRQCTFYK
jgi:hypothetical protein